MSTTTGQKVCEPCTAGKPCQDLTSRDCFATNANNECKASLVDCFANSMTTPGTAKPTTVADGATFAAGNCPSQCVIGVGKPCQDINGVNGGKNNCYNPDAGTGSCAAGLLDCRATTTTVTTKATTTRITLRVCRAQGALQGRARA